MKKIHLLMIALFTTTALSHASNIGFTAAEGFTNGSLGGQTAAGGTWTTSGGFTVNTGSGGSLNYDSSSGWLAAHYGASLGGTVTSITQAVDFTFVRGSATGNSGNPVLLGIVLTSQNNLNTTGDFLQLRQKGGTNTFDITMNLGGTGFSFNAPQSGGFVQGPTFSGTLIGLSNDETDPNSGNLRLTLVTNYTGSSDIWNLSATLMDVATSTDVASMSANMTAPSAWTTADKYTNLFYGPLSTQAVGTSVSISELQIIPEPSTWALLAGSLTVIAVFRRRSFR